MPSLEDSVSDLETVDQKNEARVMFPSAKIKNVCSPHSGSILGTEGPVVRITDEMRERAVKVFSSHLEEHQTTIERHDMKTILHDIGFCTDFKDIDVVIDKFYGPVSEPFDGDFLCDFIERFQAPSYQYGARLRRCVARGLLAEALELIIRGCHPNSADGEGLTCLHYAAEFNQTAILREILQMCPPPQGGSPSSSVVFVTINAQCRYGWTPLYSAAHHGNSECVEVLLHADHLKPYYHCDTTKRHHADPTMTNNMGKLPLHAAAAQGRTSICELLIIASAPPPSHPPNRNNSHHGHHDKHGHSTAQSVAASKASSRRGSGASHTPAHHDEHDDHGSHHGAIKLLPHNDVLVVNTQDKHGLTPLHEAAYKGHEKTYHALLKSEGIDADLLDVMKNTASNYLNVNSA